IDTCAECNAAIPGYYHSDVIAVANTPTPSYCIQCGTAYPWRAAAIENLQELLREGGLEADDIAAAERAIPDVIQETPKTESATIKLGRVLQKMGKPAYDVAIQVLSDLASETAKKTLGLPT
ncbi:MAG TPA: DUF2321 domain-containing protein, partial [Caulobacteraceae bacterium]|nr:DUF2321 domain-containing protein [Caulobacteraceae bacterium]